MRRAAKARQDDLWSRIPGDETTDAHVAWLYHRSCYKSYTSQNNVSHVHNTCLASASSEDKENACTRQSMPELGDWTTCVFCHSRKRDTLHQMKTKACEGSFRDAAKSRRDVNMMAQIEGVDLVAEKAVYHKSCMARYINKKEINRLVKHEQPADFYQSAFVKLLEEIDQPIRNGQAFTMKNLAERFVSFLPDVQADSYRTEKLQKRLKKHYGDDIVIQSHRGQGKSSILMSSDISMRDAIQALASLKEETSLDEMTLGGNVDGECGEMDESTTLHVAMGILRREMARITPPTDYPSSSDVGLKAAEAFVPALLARCILWLLDEKSFEHRGESNYMPSPTIWRRVLSICECLIYCSHRHITPLHLGLAVQLHHQHGKRSIIDQLSSHGFTISYDELRRFMTAVGQNEMEKNKAGVYIPHGLIHTQAGGSLIQEGADNVDINCETVDGKGTFHAMARVVFQIQAVGHVPSTQKTPKGRSKSLSVPPTDESTAVIPYQKPLRRPEPPRCEDATSVIRKLAKHISSTTEIKDLMWVLLRASPRFDDGILPPDVACDAQVTPFWTGFNASLSKKPTTRTVSAYPPIIDEKPADPTTVYTTMLRCKKMTNQLGQAHSIQTMDQQLYAIAQQVKWNVNKENGTLQQHIVRLGGFHGVSTFIATIGKLWGDGGLRALLVDSDVYAACTADMMLEGKQFHRAVRGITLVYEAMMQLFLSEFLRWCDAEGKTISPRVWVHLSQTTEALKEASEEHRVQAVEQLGVELTQHIIPLLTEFRRHGCAASPTFQYWLMFMDAVQVLLSNIRAEREGDWPLHLATQLAMVPYYFSANRTNYARWTPVYLLDMARLPSEVAEAFSSGEFAVRHTAAAFNGIWSDLGTETTVIRDAKGDGGIIGLTRRQGALTRWLLTRHILGQYRTAMDERSGQSSGNNISAHEQTLPAAMKQDERHAQDIINHVEQYMTHPFNTEQHPDMLVNIGSGMIASSEVQQSLLKAVEMGERRMHDFIESVFSAGNERSLYNPIPRSNLKTFSDLNKKTRVTLNGKAKEINMNSELVFRRALKIAQLRSDVNVKTVLSFPVTSVPAALFHDDGAMRKTNKAELLHILEAKVSADVKSCTDHARQSQPDSGVYIRDAMAELQAMGMAVQNFHTFEELAASYMRKLLAMTRYAVTIVDVFDQYNNSDSIKAEERNRRLSARQAARQYQVTATRTIPPWQKFMAHPANKMALTDFLCCYMKEHVPATEAMMSNPQRRLLLAGGFSDGEITCCITKDGATDVSELSSSQEEADSRMLLHAWHANQEFGTAGIMGDITIKSPDTDVLVLAVHYFPQMQSIKTLWLETGRTTSSLDQRRFIPVHQICHKLHSSVPAVLPAVHAITGCDSTSSLYGIGKKKAMKLVESLAETDDLPPLQLLGTDNEVATSAARKLTAMLYDPKVVLIMLHLILNVNSIM